MKKKKNKNNRSIIDTVKNLTKKTGQVEKEKREKKKRLKNNKPRGYMARRIGSISFWIITSFVLLFIIVNIGGKSSDDEEVIVVDSEVTSYSAVEYSRSFLNDLFNIPEDSDEKTKREEKLAKYTISQKEIASSFDSENVVKVDRKNIILKSMTKPEHDERARHTFSLDLVIEEKFTDEESDEFDSLDKDEKQAYIDKMMEDDEGIISINNKKKIREERLYVVVAIEHNETGFVIYENPSFTFVHDEDKGINNMYSELNELSDSEVTDNLENFLNTFFKSFATDDKDSLAYLLDDEEYSYGLGNTMDFEQVNEAEFYEGKDKDYIAKTSVTFINNETNLKMNAEYMLVIKKSGDKHIVTHINDDEYIYEVLYGEEEDDESEEGNENNENNDEVGNEINEDTNEELESAFNDLIESLHSNDLEKMKAVYHEEPMETLKESLVEMLDEDIDELSEEELNELAIKFVEAVKEDNAKDKEKLELYDEVENMNDLAVVIASELLIIFSDEETDTSEFSNYTASIGENENEYILHYKTQDEEDANSETEINLIFAEKDGSLKLMDFNNDYRDSFDEGDIEFILDDGVDAIEDKTKEEKESDKKGKKDKNDKKEKSKNDK